MRPVSLVKVATETRTQRALAPPFVVHQGPRTRGSPQGEGKKADHRDGLQGAR